MKKAIIIGASSGIGRELAKVLSDNNYIVGLVARREDLLKNVRKELPTCSFIKSFDVSNVSRSMHQFEELFKVMGGANLIVIGAGCGFINPELDFEKEQRTIEVNVFGFTAMVNVAYKLFKAQGHGHIAAISSVAALRGSQSAPAYSASKAFVSNYMEGIRIRAKKEKNGIIVTDIIPGFVDTAMAQGEGLFWVAPARKAALQIYRALSKNKKQVYITRRWRFIALLLKVMPEWLCKNL